MQIGGFRIGFVRVATGPRRCLSSWRHSAGRVLHTGDWKLDHTPVDGLRTDVGRLAELGTQGVDLMLGDSTNAERPGVTARNGSSARRSNRSSWRPRRAAS